ncbi:major facilitator superfamily domain-containing protein [Aspergillus granulosus]|uniref:Major facilitator superfamily domain-containing protein n=1 Tax=Aspergillus granulosus TaxID=176169 RepID=A0ABR4HJ74_9EURO
MKRHERFPDGETGISVEKNEFIDLEDNDALHCRLADLRKDDCRLRQLFDLKVLPSMMIVALMFGIETTVFSYAVVFGRTEDLGLSETQFSWLNSAPHVPKILLQFPIAWVLVDGFPLDKAAPFLLSLCATLFQFLAAAGVTGLMAARLTQGLLDAFIVPSLVSMTQTYWTRVEQPLRMSCWFSMSGLATIVMSTWTYCLASTAYKGPDSLLILNCTGILFFVYLLWSFFSGASPMELKFLSDREKKIAYGLKRLSDRRNCDWSQKHVQHTKTDPKTWLWFGLIFCASLPVSGINSLSPLLLKSLDADPSRALLNVPFGAAQIMAIMGSGLATTRYRSGPVISTLCLVSMTGFMILARALQTPGSTRNSVLTGYYLIAAAYGVIPLIYNWSGANTAGVTKKKATAAFIFLGQSLGNVCGPLLFTPSSGQILGTRGLWTTVTSYCCIIVLAAATSIHLRSLNEDHARRCEAQGKKVEVPFGCNNRLDSVLDVELMQRPEASILQADEADDGYGLPYLFRPRIYEGLTDLEDEEFFFTL